MDLLRERRSTCHGGVARRRSRWSGCRKCSGGEEPQWANLASSLICVQSDPACWARGEQIEMSRAVYELQKAEMRTSAGLRLVPGIRPGTSVSAVQSQDWGATCASAVTALWPQVASPKAQHVAWATPVSRDPDWQVAPDTGSQDPKQPRRKRTESTYSSGSSVDPWYGLRRHIHVWSISASPSSNSRTWAPQARSQHYQSHAQTSKCTATRRPTTAAIATTSQDTKCLRPAQTSETVKELNPSAAQFSMPQGQVVQTQCQKLASTWHVKCASLGEILLLWQFRFKLFVCLPGVLEPRTQRPNRPKRQDPRRSLCFASLSLSDISRTPVWSTILDDWDDGNLVIPKALKTAGTAAASKRQTQKLAHRWRFFLKKKKKQTLRVQVCRYMLTDEWMLVRLGISTWSRDVSEHAAVAQIASGSQHYELCSFLGQTGRFRDGLFFCFAMSQRRICLHAFSLRRTHLFWICHPVPARSFKGRHRHVHVTQLCSWRGSMTYFPSRQTGNVHENEWLMNQKNLSKISAGIHFIDAIKRLSKLILWLISWSRVNFDDLTELQYFEH